MGSHPLPPCMCGIDLQSTHAARLSRLAGWHAETRECRTVAVVEATGNGSICLPAAFTAASLTAADAAALPAVVSECLGGQAATADLNCREVRPRTPTPTVRGADYLFGT